MFPDVMWFKSVPVLVAAANTTLKRMIAIEDNITSVPVVDGYCVNCEAITPMTVFGGAMLGHYINLREGMVCQACGLNARSRLLLHAAGQVFPSSGAELAVMEAFSAFAGVMRRRWPESHLSEYFGPAVAAGADVRRPGLDGVDRTARHEDLMRLSYGDASLDGIIHNDVLEHVADVDIAFAQMHRVLRPGGVALFTMPWFPWMQRTQVRGRLRSDDSLEEFLPTELHGDGLRAGGIYTFYNFGADLEEMLIRAGFDQIRYGVCYCPTAGFLTNNNRYGSDGLMLPSVLTARRPL